jgi:hypothetical protein
LLVEKRDRSVTGICQTVIHSFVTRPRRQQQQTQR